MVSERGGRERETGAAHAVLWRELCERLREEVGDGRFERWVEPLKIVSGDGPDLVVAVPNEYMRDWLERHYLRRVRALLREPLRRVRFEIDPDRFPECGREQEAVFGGRPPGASRAVNDEAFAVSSSLGLDGTAGRVAYERRGGGAFSLAGLVVGPSNRFAVEAVRHVLAAPGDLYSPLFLFGPSGVGKTHLLRGIEAEFREMRARFSRGDGLPPALKARLEDAGQARTFRVRYVTAESFVNQFLASLKSRELAAFRQKFRSADVLLVDDVHLLPGKEKSQEEFLHTLCAVHERGGQIVLASQVVPGELIGLIPALRARFVGGVPVGVKAPDRTMRLAVLERAAAQRGSRFDRAVLEFLADLVGGSVRELLGALARLDLTARVEGGIDVERAREILAAEYVRRPRRPSLERLAAVVADYYRLSSESIVGRDQRREATFARQVFVFLARQYTDRSYREIGRFLGGRKHSTVSSSVTKIGARLDADPHFAREIDALVERVQALR